MSGGDDPAHKAMLFFLEVLMNSNGPLTISQLAGRFGSRSFSTEMRNACGGNESGLKKFLQKYPSLFQLKGGVVSLFDGRQTNSPTPSSSGMSTPDSSKSSSSGIAISFATPQVHKANGNVGVVLRPLPDVTTEMAAVQYFQSKLWKKEDGWMPIRSLAGHLSQASIDIRNVVGPQLEFKSWLLRHPHIFHVQGDAVRLQDGIDALVTNPSGRPLSMSDISMLTSKIPQGQRKSPPGSLFGGMQRSRSFGEKMASLIMGEAQECTSLVASSQSSPFVNNKKLPIAGTNANEYKALVYLKDVLEKNGAMKLHSLTVYLSKAPESTQNAVGWTKMEMEDFLRKYSNIFSISAEEIVALNRDTKILPLATGNYPLPPSYNGRTLCGQGKIYHVAKLWGIIDLGKHEHVFFDRSIMKRPMEDLQKEFHVGEMLCFSAVLAPKTSRSKWRAVQVWKEHEQQPSLLSSSQLTTPSSEAAHLVEEEINRFLPDADDSTSEELLDGWIESPVIGVGPATPSSPPKSSISIADKINCNGEEPVSSCNAFVNVDERHVILLSGKTNGDGKFEISSKTQIRTSEELKLNGGSNIIDRGLKLIDVACQTISTGSIISTQFYHES